MNSSTRPVDIRPDHLEIVQGILREHLPVDVKVWVFGSRANWTTKDSSDLDLALEGENKLSHKLMGALKGAFEESSLPYTVDVVDLSRIGDSFRRIVESQRVPLPLDADGAGRRAKQAGSDGWRTSLWGELATLEYGKSLRKYDPPTGIYKVYGTNGPIGWHGEPLCPYASVIIGRKGAYRGVHYSPDPFFVIDTAFYLKPKVELDTRWAYYQLLTQDINGMDSGSAIPSTSREDFYGLPVEVPPLDEQRAIAHVLGTLDDKIELNRRMNETLEEMARALFKSWFVDFEPVRAKMEGRWRRGESLAGLPADLYGLFPDRLVDSELGEIPEGWGVRPLGEVAHLNPESWSKTNNPASVEYVDLANTKWGVIESTQHFSWKGAPSRARRVLRSGDTIVGTVRPGNGSYSLIGNDGLTGSTGFAVLRPLHPCFRELIYLSATAPDNIEWLAHRADGAAYPAVRPEVVSEAEVAIPAADTGVVAWFSKTVGAFLDKIESAKTESRALSVQRDALLPGLVSGDVRIKHLERLLTGEAK